MCFMSDTNLYLCELGQVLALSFLRELKDIACDLGV